VPKAEQREFQNRAQRPPSGPPRKTLDGRQCGRRQAGRPDLPSAPDTHLPAAVRRRN
jgi:hypothetical protein